jgi:hypothetical protein
MVSRNGSAVIPGILEHRSNHLRQPDRTIQAAGLLGSGGSTASAGCVSDRRSVLAEHCEIMQDTSNVGRHRRIGTGHPRARAGVRQWRAVGILCLRRTAVPLHGPGQAAGGGKPSALGARRSGRRSGAGQLAWAFGNGRSGRRAMQRAGNVERWLPPSASGPGGG